MPPWVRPIRPGQVLNSWHGPSAVLAALVLPATVVLPPAQGSEFARVLEILDGTQLFIEARQAKVNETALSPQQISTQNSRGQLLFRSGAAARINRFTQLRLGKSCFLLAKGQVLISGKRMAAPSRCG